MNFCLNLFLSIASWHWVRLFCLEQRYSLFEVWLWTTLSPLYKIWVYVRPVTWRKRICSDKSRQLQKNNENEFFFIVRMLIFFFLKFMSTSTWEQSTIDSPLIAKISSPTLNIPSCQKWKNNLYVKNLQTKNISNANGTTTSFLRAQKPPHKERISYLLCYSSRCNTLDNYSLFSRSMTRSFTNSKTKATASL